MRFAKVATLGLVAFVALACTGIAIPSIPAIPSFPPITLPSGGTLPPGVLPSSSGTCTFISADEVTAVMGSAATLSNTDNGGCAFLLSNFTSVSISIETGTDLQGAKFIMGTSAQDLTVGGLAAVSGAVFGQAAVYVQKGANQLQVLGILTGTDDAMMAKIVQIATIAASRWPG